MDPVQFAQVPPSTPHAFFCVPGWQVPLPAQHPLQLVASHLQVPPMQNWPFPHGAPVPQPQLPFVRQVSAFTGSQVTHAPPAVPQVVVLWG